VLPPAGKNFYKFSNKNAFVSAQKYGSMTILSPNTYNGRISLAQKYKPMGFNGYLSTKFKSLKAVDSKKSGKKLFPQSNVSYTPMKKDSPSRSNPKVDHMYGDAMYDNLSKTLDYRTKQDDNPIYGK
jgi:hypothetical protein